MTSTISGIWKYRYTKITPVSEYRVKPCAYGSNPRLVSHWLTRPLEPMVAMKMKASGTPPKLANTPAAVIATCRSTCARLAVKIAYATISPRIPGMTAEITDKTMLCQKPLR